MTGFMLQPLHTQNKGKQCNKLGNRKNVTIIIIIIIIIIITCSTHNYSSQPNAKTIVKINYFERLSYSDSSYI